MCQLKKVGAIKKMQKSSEKYILGDIKTKYYATIKRHIFVCTGSKCVKDEMGEELFQTLKKKLNQIQPDKSLAKVHRSKSSCLGICAHGPLAVVYPDGILYYHLKVDDLDQLIEEHLIKGRPVDSLPHFRMPAL
jgi:(2Fe-2S) ferredoxin